MRLRCGSAVATALVMGVALAACGSPRPSVVLVVIDTLRADRLAPYGFDPELTPEISKLAERGTTFRHVTAASPWTTGSVASILTGRYPDELGIDKLWDELPASAVTLAEALERAGYTTGAVVSNALIAPSLGYDQGFARFYIQWYTGGPNVERKVGVAGRPIFTADRVSDEALAWIGGAREPFFLYVHYMDPHDPYRPPLEWLEARAPGVPRLKEVGESALARLESAALADVEAHYEAEIAFADHEIGRLLEALSPRTLVILTADHGEELMDHGSFLHGHTLYQELLRVPLIVAGPGVSRGAVADGLVSHVDIAPTVLDWAGVDGTAAGSGRSLRPELEDPARSAAPRALFSFGLGVQPRQPRLHHERMIAVREGRWKLVQLPPTTELYDLSSDPEERTDLSERHPRVASRLSRLVSQRRRLLQGAGEVPLPTPPLREQKQALHALGYLE